MNTVPCKAQKKLMIGLGFEHIPGTDRYNNMLWRKEVNIKQEPYFIDILLKSEEAPLPLDIIALVARKAYGDGEKARARIIRDAIECRYL